MEIPNIEIIIPEKPIPNIHVQSILESAQLPKSDVYDSPWDYVFLDQEDGIDKIRVIYPFAKMLKKPVFAIIVCKYLHETPASEKAWRFQASPEIAEQIWAMDHNGLSAVWLGAYIDEIRCEYLKKQFQLPSYLETIAVVVVGKIEVEAPPYTLRLVKPKPRNP